MPEQQQNAEGTTAKALPAVANQPQKPEPKGEGPSRDFDWEKWDKMMGRPELTAQFFFGRMYSWHCRAEFKYGDRTVTIEMKRPRLVPWLYEKYEPRFTSWSFAWLILSVSYWHWKGRNVPPSAEEVAEKEAREFNDDDLRYVAAAAIFAQAQWPDGSEAHPNAIGLRRVAEKMRQHGPWYGREPSAVSARPSQSHQ